MQFGQRGRSPVRALRGQAPPGETRREFEGARCEERFGRQSGRGGFLPEGWSAEAVVFDEVPGEK